jgi:hypothetical protein
MGFSDKENQIIWIITCIGASLSVIGTGFICFMYLAFSNLRGYSYRLICYLALSDFFVSAMFIVPDEAMGSYCWIKGAMLNYASLWNILITGVISLSIYKGCFGEIQPFIQKEFWIVFITNAIAISFSALPLITDSYGSAHGVCWISASGDDYLLGTMWRFISFYIPFWMIVILNVAIYIKVIHKIRHNSVTECRMEAEEMVLKLKIYPVIAIVAMLPSTIRRLYNILYPDDSDFTLAILTSIFTPSLGLADAIVYGLNSKVRSTIYGVINPITLDDLKDTIPISS